MFTFKHTYLVRTHVFLKSHACYRCLFLIEFYNSPRCFPSVLDLVIEASPAPPAK